MDIAVLSIGLSQIKVHRQAAVSVMRMAMNTENIQAEALKELADVSAKTMEQAVQPHLGKIIDIRL